MTEDKIARQGMKCHDREYPKWFEQMFNLIFQRLYFSVHPEHGVYSFCQWE
jgi:hypothetical protein